MISLNVVHVQVVAGTNYLVKANHGSEVVHLRIHKPLPHTGLPPILAGIERNKAVDSALVPFEPNLLQ
jgi:hypothetical protein